MSGQSSPRKRRWTVEHLLNSLGIGLIAAIILLVFFPPMLRNVEEDRHFRSLEKRIVDVEKKIEALGSEPKIPLPDKDVSSRLQKMAAEISEIRESRELDRRRMDETSVNIISRLDVLTKDLEKKKAPDVRGASVPIAKEEKNRGKLTPGKDPVKKDRIRKTSEKTSRKADVKVQTPLYHQVRQGDTFYSICQTYGISLQKLKEMNHFDEKAKIRPGQKILVKP